MKRLVILLNDYDAVKDIILRLPSVDANDVAEELKSSVVESLILDNAFEPNEEILIKFIDDFKYNVRLTEEDFLYLYDIISNGEIRFGRGFLEDVLDTIIYKVHFYPVIDYLFSKGIRTTKTIGDIEAELQGTNNDDLIPYLNVLEKYGLFQRNDRIRVRNYILEI